MSGLWKMTERKMNAIHSGMWKREERRFVPVKDDQEPIFFGGFSCLLERSVYPTTMPVLLRLIEVRARSCTSFRYDALYATMVLSTQKIDTSSPGACGVFHSRSCPCSVLP